MVLENLDMRIWGGAFQLLQKKIMIQSTELEMKMQFRLSKNCLHPFPVPGWPKCHVCLLGHWVGEVVQWRGWNPRIGDPGEVGVCHPTFINLWRRYQRCFDSWTVKVVDFLWVWIFFFKVKSVNIYRWISSCLQGHCLPNSFWSFSRFSNLSVDTVGVMKVPTSGRLNNETVSRWFFVTSLSPSWRSFDLWKGHLPSRSLT